MFSNSHVRGRGDDDGKSRPAGASGSGVGKVIPEGGVPPSSSPRRNTPGKNTKKASSDGGKRAAPRRVRSVDGYRSKSTKDTIATLGFSSLVDIQIPSRDDRPWAVPPGFICVYEAFFREGRLSFPFPRPLIDFCFRKDIALAQLTPFAVLNLVGLIVFGAEVRTIVDADFLEKAATLVANPSTPGTLYAQVAGGSPVTSKPPKALGDGERGEWQDYYFFLRATPVVMGVGAPPLRTNWNREIGVAYRDSRLGGSSNCQDKVIARMLYGVQREYALFDQGRVERQWEAVASIPWAKRGEKRFREDVEASDGEEEENSVALVDHRLAKRRIVIPSEEASLGGRTREECLEVVRRKREERREREMSRGGAVNLSPKERRYVSVLTPGASSSAPQNVVDPGSAPLRGPSVNEEGCAAGRHHFSFEYRGPCPIVADPLACEELLSSVPEVTEGVPESVLNDPRQNRGEIAATHVLLMSLQNRRERVHRREIEELMRKIELRDQARDRLEAELAAEKERARVREAELAAGAKQLEKLRARVDRLQHDLGGRDDELGARLRELKVSEEKLFNMNELCRRRTSKALKDQLSVFEESCEEQSQNAVTVVQGYLGARGRWEAADRRHSQTKGAFQVLTGLKGDGVPIPDDIIAGLAEEEKRCDQERRALEVKGLSSEDFEFALPPNLSVPEFEQDDFDVVPAELAEARDGARRRGESSV